MRKHRPDKITFAEPNSFFETQAIEKLGRKLRIRIEFVPTAQFLLPRADFRKWAGGQRRLVMENHYRRMRKRFGWLVDANGQPEGGAWNYDVENRATFTAWRRAGTARTNHTRRKAG
jgi:deoxyribodipyrimidine photolyase-related protein